MTALLSAILAAVFAALGLLHVAWAFGGRLAGSAVIPATADGKPTFAPGPFSTLAVAVALFAAAALVTWRGGWWQLPLPFVLARAGCWLLAVLFLLRAVGEFRYVGLFKRVRGTRFARWDSRLFTPLCLVISVLTALLAWSAP
jgi:hypothetical protein